MRPRNRIAHVAPLLLIALALAACGPDGAGAPAAQPGSASTGASAPSSAVVTSAPPTAAPSAAGDLTGDALLAAVRSTFATFPRRVRQTATNKADNTVMSATVEAETAGRMHLARQVNGQLSEAVLISPTLYLKLPDGWQERHDPIALAFLGRVADPVDFLAAAGFDQLIAAPSAASYKQIGMEQVGRVQTQVYQRALRSAAIDATYTFWLGADGRLYKMESVSGQLTSSTVMEFDPRIKVAAPLL